MEEKKEKKVGFRILVYWFDQKEPDVLVLHRYCETALCAWIEELQESTGGSVTHVEVRKFYYEDYGKVCDIA